MSNIDTVSDLFPNAHTYGNYVAANCVFHDDSTPSLMIYEDYYKCLSCGAFGRTKYLIQKMNGGELRPKDNAKQFFPRLWNYLEEYDIEDMALEAYHRLNIAPDFRGYLRKRKIDDVTAKRLLVGYMDQFYTFPVINYKREIIGIVARANSVVQDIYQFRYIMPRGQKPLLYVPDWEKMYDPAIKNVYMTYGILDAISLSICGFAACSGTAGHVVPDELLQDIRKRIIIIRDGDGKDDKAASSLMTALDWRGKIWKGEYPEGCKDMNDVFVKHGKDTVKEILCSN